MHFPRVNNRPQATVSVETSEVANHAIRYAARRLNNPFVEALIQEMEPEINRALKRGMGDCEIDLTKMHHGLTRASRVIDRINGRRA